jgi:hypothetical protein
MRHMLVMQLEEVCVFVCACVCVCALRVSSGRRERRVETILPEDT